MWKVFNQHDPQMHKWYHEGVAEALKELQGTFAYQEYVSLIKKLIRTSSFNIFSIGSK